MASVGVRRFCTKCYCACLWKARKYSCTLSLLYLSSRYRLVAWDVLGTTPANDPCGFCVQQSSLSCGPEQVSRFESRADTTCVTQDITMQARCHTVKFCCMLTCGPLMRNGRHRKDGFFARVNLWSLHCKSCVEHRQPEYTHIHSQLLQRRHISMSSMNHVHDPPSGDETLRHSMPHSLELKACLLHCTTAQFKFNTFGSCLSPHSV